MLELDFREKAEKEGLTDRQMHKALKEMGYNFYNSDKTVNWIAMCEMAINEGYRWNDKNKKWFY